MRHTALSVSVSALRNGRWIALPVALAAGFAFNACEQEPAASSPAADPGGPGGGGRGGVAGPQCEAGPETGCACPAEGATAECGELIQKHDGYISCSVGTRTCADGLWGACQGEKVATKAFEDRAYPSVEVQGLSPTPGACVGNPCNPYCVGYNDTPDGVLDAGLDSGLVLDGGVTVPGVQALGYSCTGMALTPPSAVATVSAIPEDPAPLMVTYVPSPPQFAVQLLPVGCAPAPAAVWTVDKPGTASISAGGLLNVYAAVASTVNVTGFASGFKASAPVDVVVNAWRTDPSTPVGVTKASFQVAASTPDSITWLYPYDGTVYPLRLEAPMPQWTPGSPADAVRVILRFPADGSKFTWSGMQGEKQLAPTPGIPAQPRGLIPPKVWREFEQAAQGQDGFLSVQRIVFGVLRVENPQVRIRFSTASLRGSVYYNSYGSNLVTNYSPTYNGARFGAATLAIRPGATSPVLITGSDTQCFVCHSVAANGSRLVTNDAFASNADGQQRSLQVDLGSFAASYLGAPDARFSWPAIAPNGSYLFTNAGAAYTNSSDTPSAFYAMPSMAPLPSPGLPAGLRALTPSFSPEGTSIAYNDYNLDRASLVTLDHNVATHAISNRVVLATPGVGGVGAGKIYYPAFLPQAAGGDVVYELETRYNGRDVAGTRSGCDARGPTACQDEGSHGELWSVNRATKQSVRLDKLNGRGYVPLHPSYAPKPGADPEFNYEATVNPQVSGGYAWIVFTSRRRYGNIATINPFWSDPRFQDLRFQPTTKKLWVSAVALNAPSGFDGSSPAFYLPGQELLAGNARGYWVVDPCIPAGSATTCESTIDCCVAPGVACTQDAAPAITRHCRTNPAPACKLATESCAVSADCCGNPTFQCISGTCQPPAPPLFFYPAEFSRDYEGVCPENYRVKWTNFGLQALTPGPGGSGDYTRVDVRAQVADARALLTAAASVPAGTLAGPPVNQALVFTNFDMSAALGAPQNTRSWIRVTMKLQPTADNKLAPTLVNWRQQYDCVPNE